MSASLESDDYAAIPHNPDGAYQYTFTGYRYFLQLYNTTDQDATVSFRVTMDHASSGSAASPYGRISFNPDGSYTIGAYADAGPAGGVTDRSTEDQFGRLPNAFGDFAATTYAESPGVSTPTFSSSDPYGFTAIYVLPKGQIHTFQIYASASASAQFSPHPRPRARVVRGPGPGRPGLPAAQRAEGHRVVGAREPRGLAGA